MAESLWSVNVSECRVSQVSYRPSTILCDRCHHPCTPYSVAQRHAIDLNLDHPELLFVTIGVYRCSQCHHYFRAQPPFLRPDAIYTNRVIDKAVQSVFGDGMAIRRVGERLARDFWVQPGESTIRGWCRTFGSQFDFVTDYQNWVVQEFSGVLCVDEVYQDQLALLLAVDPAGPNGDQLVGYQLEHGPVNGADVLHFLENLKQVGIEPDQVITDGSQLYPAVLAQVWPNAAHQLCLFHETRRVTGAVMDVINAVRRHIPHPPPAPGFRGGGLLRGSPPTSDTNTPDAQRWYWRQMQRHQHIAQVHSLAGQGLSLRAISRQTGHHRKTIKRWLAQPVPELPDGMPAEMSALAALPPAPQVQERKQEQVERVHQLAREGLSNSGIARQVGIGRTTVKRWLLKELPAVEKTTDTQSAPESIPPPNPWVSWGQVTQVREIMREHRFLLLRRPENLKPEQQQLVDFLLASPLRGQLLPVYSFLTEWYALWRDENGLRRPLSEARSRYEAWRTDPVYRAVPRLRRVLERMTPEKFEKMSHFLNDPNWEATNNGAERAGRAFRHRQAPHFNLRKKENIEQAINVAACMHKERVTRPLDQRLPLCQRGRRHTQEPDSFRSEFTQPQRSPPQSSAR